MKNEEIIEKLYAGELLSEQEIKKLLWTRKTVDEIEHGSGRWTENITTVLELKPDELWAIDWERGLTEYQEDYYEYQPRRVVRKTRMVEIAYYEEV